MKPRKISESLPKRTTRHDGSKAREIRVLAMRYPELGPSALARRVGVSPQSAADTLKRFLGNHSEDDLRKFQQSKPDAYDALQLRCLESVTGAKMMKSSAMSLITGAAILEDKSRLIRGMPTNLDVHVLLDLMAVVRGDREKN